MAPSPLRAFAVLFAVVAVVVACFTQEAQASAAPSPTAPTCIPASKCCMVCDAGQACGNSCISRSKQCHKGRGCSCNLAEVCP